MRIFPPRTVIFIILVLLSTANISYAEERADTSSEYLCEYGLSLYRKGDINGAIHEFRKALQVNPNNTKAQDYLTKILQDGKTSQQVPSENKKFSKLAISASPKICVNQESVFYAESNIGDNATYEWDFGDGTTGEAREITKIYSQAGVYRVKLTQYYELLGKSHTSRTTKVVTIYSPPIAEAGEDIASCLEETVVLDGSKSRVTNSIERCLGCSPLIYTWDFGDGSPKAKGAKVKHIYHNPGIYKATLKVKDSKLRKCSTSQDITTVLVNTAPDVVIREIPLSCPETEIDFAIFRKATGPNLDMADSNIADRNYLKCTWDFGDGTVREGGPDITHSYQQGGEYLIKAEVDDQRGTRCSQANASLKLRINLPPVANAGPNLVCCTNTESVFDGSGSFDPDGGTLTYTWDFGDGSVKAKGAKATHIYTKNGNYKVTLKVDDNSGLPCSSSTSSFTVTVHEKPVSIIKVIKDFFK